jgi:hypothetical protein
MGLSHRKFVIDQNDRVCRLASKKFDAMLRNPASHRFLQFAGQRVRAVSTTVELANRQPIQVVLITFDILTFDDTGRFDLDTYRQQQFSRAEVAIAPLIASLDRNTDVVDSASRFIAQGGRWTPSPTLARAIDDAALGRMKCAQL